MANRRRGKLLPAGNKFSANSRTKIPFVRGQLVCLEKPLLFTPPGVYRFEGVSGTLMHFKIGKHGFTLHSDFLYAFKSCGADEREPDAEAESRYVQATEALIGSIAGKLIEEEEIAPGVCVSVREISDAKLCTNPPSALARDER